MRSGPWFPSLLVSAGLAGCAGAGVSPTLQVERALAHYDSLSLRMVHDSIAAFFTPDGEMVNAGQAPIVGPAAIRDHLHSFTGFRVLANRLTADSTVVRGDSARQTGTFWQRVRLPAGDTVEVHGRFEANWIRLGADGWRLRRLATAPPR